MNESFAIKVMPVPGQLFACIIESPKINGSDKGQELGGMLIIGNTEARSQIIGAPTYKVVDVYSLWASQHARKDQAENVKFVLVESLKAHYDEIRLTGFVKLSRNSRKAAGFEFDGKKWVWIR